MRCLFRVRLETEMGQWLPARVGREERGGGTVQRRFVVGCHQKILYCYYFIFMCPRCYLHKDGRSLLCCSGCGSASLAVAGAASGSGRSPGKHKKRFARLFRIVNFYVSDSVCVCATVCVLVCVCGRFSAAPAPAASRSNHTHCN